MEKKMATYNTQQKKELMDFLKKHPERAYTIDDIAAGMKSDPEFANPPGKSTIYRLMPGLSQENLVKCFSAGRGTKATYQIMGGESCHFHIHLKCTGCGKLLCWIWDELSFSVSAGAAAKRQTPSRKENIYYENKKTYNSCDADRPASVRLLCQ